jgi:Mg2+-importing ATPase
VPTEPPPSREPAFSDYTIGSPEDVFRRLESSPRGLADAEAQVRARRYGLNSISYRRVTAWTILLSQFRSPFVYLLLGAAVLSFLLREFIDGGFIVAFVLLNAGLGFYQEYHSQHTLKLLQRYTVPRARVLRDGAPHLVPSPEVVPGDVVVLGPGDILPADTRFARTQNLEVNESVLTGESGPVPKQSAALPHPVRAHYQAQNLGFAGTSVVSGTATAVVFATGNATAFGAIAKLSGETPRVSGYSRELGRFSRFTLQLIGATLILLVVANLLIKGGSANITELIIFSIALAVSVTPEALPLVTTFALSRGALRLARHKVVVKRLSSVEDLGSIEVLCTDKTGTLTENTLSVADVTAPDREAALKAAALAGSAATGTTSASPFDAAVTERLPLGARRLLDGYTRIAELPFDPVRRRNTVLVRGFGRTELIVRGAPEVVLARCAGISTKRAKALELWVAGQGDLGHRTLAVAARRIQGAAPKNLETAEHDLALLGILAFADPIKPTTLAAVRAAEQLGIAVKILTGDSREVTGAVAHTIGLTPSAHDVITGEELAALSPAEQHAAVERYHAFARLSPEQKFTILQLLRERHAVGFLGEGINDAPALAIADVALVVPHAADIAREAADIVLLNPSLHVIVDGIRQGRQVFANITKYITATLSANFGNFYAVAAASLFIPFLPLLPLQILLVNLLSDFPMIAVATDTVDSADLKRPRRYDMKGILLLATVLGVVSTGFDFIFFGVFVGSGESVLQTQWFIGSILTELAFLFSVRARRFFLASKRPSTAVLVLTTLAVLVTVGLPFTGFGQAVFQFQRPATATLMLTLGIVAAYFISTETVKLLYFRFLAATGEGRRKPRP